jgi:hypothetical protein
MAFNKGTTWNQYPGDTPGANDGFHVLSYDLGVFARESLPDDSMGNRNQFLASADKGNRPTDVRSINQYLRLDESERMLGYAMGTCTVTLRSGARDHTVRPAACLDGIFGVIDAEQKDGSIIHSYPSVKFDGFEIAGEAGQFLTAQYSVFASKFMNSGGASASNMNSVTARTTGNRVYFDRARLWINDQSGATLAAADLVEPSKLSLRLNRSQEAYHAASGETDGDEASMKEPTGGPQPEFMFDLEFPVKTADTWIDVLGNDTRKKGRLHFNLGTAVGSSTYMWDVYMPHLELMNVEEAVDGHGKIVAPLKFRCLQAASAVQGMDYTDPFYFVFTNSIVTALTSL